MDVIEAMKTNSTCRYFKTDPIPGDVMERVLDATRWAPQGGNRQPVRWVVVTDPEKKAQLKEWYNIPWKAYLAQAEEGGINIGHDALGRVLQDADNMAEAIVEIPAIVVVCADLEEIHPTDLELDRLSVVAGGSIYPSVQNLLLAARNEGLGTALTTLLVMFEPQVKELLEIPDNLITAAHVMMGYPERGFPTSLSRRPLSEVAFAESYGQPLASA